MPVEHLDEAVEVLEQLPREAALADAGDADDRDQPRAPLACRGVIQVAQELELGVATDEWRLDAGLPTHAAHAGDDPNGAPGSDGQLLALDCVVAGSLEGDATAGRLVGRLADEHGPGLRYRLEPRCRVDQVAGDHALPLRAEGHGRLPGQRRSAGRQPADAADADGGHRLDQVHGRPNCTLGIILVGDRRTPDRHDRVADELLDRAAVALDDLARRREVAREELTDILGVPVLGCGGEANEVGEEDRDEASFGLRRGSQGHAAAGTVGLAVAPGVPAPIVAPHSPQNRSVGWLAWPQAGQTMDRRAPHCPQNLRSASFSWPQAVQFTGADGSFDARPGA